MKLFEYIDRVNLLHRLIVATKTGTPEELANRINLSKSRLLRVIEDLKLKGAPIHYDRQSKSYYYTNNYLMQINIDFKFLIDEDAMKINGGYIITNNLFNAFFVH